jgi:hypothetical protein
MRYMDTKFCEACDQDYDWAAPECPGCASRRAWEEQAVKLRALRKAALSALSELAILPSYLDAPDTDWPNLGLKVLAKGHRKAHAELAEALAAFDAPADKE